MPEKEESLAVSVILGFRSGSDPLPLSYPVLGLPGETFEQLAARTKLVAERALGKEWQKNSGYDIARIYLGELTHELEPPPPPPPIPVVKIKEFPGRPVAGKKSPPNLKKVKGA